MGAYSYPAPGSPRPHAVTSISGQALAYDANGNLLSGRGRSYGWDGENRPRVIANAANGKTSYYIYGPDGERLWKQANTGASNGWQWSLYLGSDLEYSPNPVTGALEWTKYLHPDAKRVGSGASAKTFFHHRDHLKSEPARLV